MYNGTTLCRSPWCRVSLGRYYVSWGSLHIFPRVPPPPPAPVPGRAPTPRFGLCCHTLPMKQLQARLPGVFQTWWGELFVDVCIKCFCSISKEIKKSHVLFNLSNCQDSPKIELEIVRTCSSYVIANAAQVSVFLWEAWMLYARVTQDIYFESKCLIPVTWDRIMYRARLISARNLTHANHTQRIVKEVT